MDRKVEITRDDHFTQNKVQQLVENFHDQSISAQTLRERNNKIVSRVSLNSANTVILKLWTRRGSKALVRELIRTSELYKEVNVLQHLKYAGVRVPTLLGYCRLNPKKVGYTHAMVMEDIYPSDTGIHHFGDLIRDALYQEVRDFENSLIHLTTQMIDARVIDPDHSLINIIVDKHGLPYRIDFELARRVTSLKLATKDYGEMIGHLVATYGFVQPDTDIVNAFSRRLIQELLPPERVLHYAKNCVTRMLAKQKRNKNIDTQLDLSW